MAEREKKKKKRKGGKKRRWDKTETLSNMLAKPGWEVQGPLKSLPPPLMMSWNLCVAGPLNTAPHPQQQQQRGNQNSGRFMREDWKQQDLRQWSGAVTVPEKPRRTETSVDQDLMGEPPSTSPSMGTEGRKWRRKGGHSWAGRARAQPSQDNSQALPRSLVQSVHLLGKSGCLD